MFRIIFRAAILCLFVQLLGSATIAQINPTLTTLRLGAVPVDDVMPVLYAQREGLFTKAGLDVVVQPLGSPAITAGVTSGTLDIGKGGVASIIQAHMHNFPLVMIAPSAIYDPKNPDVVLAVNGDSSISSARDLAGKTVAAGTLGEIAQVGLIAWMEQSGVDWHSAQFVESALPTNAAMLEQRRVQAALLVKPFIADAVDSGKAKVLALTANAIAPRFVESAWFATRSFADQHRSAILAFQRIVVQASAYTNAHPDQTVDLLAAFTKISPDQAARMPRIVTGGTLSPREVQPVIDAMARYHLIEKPFNARDIFWP